MITTGVLETGGKTPSRESIPQSENGINNKKPAGWKKNKKSDDFWAQLRIMEGWDDLVGWFFLGKLSRSPADPETPPPNKGAGLLCWSIEATWRSNSFLGIPKGEVLFFLRQKLERKSTPYPNSFLFGFHLYTENTQLCFQKIGSGSFFWGESLNLWEKISRFLATPRCVRCGTRAHREGQETRDNAVGELKVVEFQYDWKHLLMLQFVKGHWITPFSGESMQIYGNFWGISRKQQCRVWVFFHIMGWSWRPPVPAETLKLFEVQIFFHRGDRGRELLGWFFAEEVKGDFFFVRVCMAFRFFFLEFRIFLYGGKRSQSNFWIFEEVREELQYQYVIFGQTLLWCHCNDLYQIDGPGQTEWTAGRLRSFSVQAAAWMDSLIKMSAPNETRHARVVG